MGKITFSRPVDHAFALAEAGYKVFPLRRGEKTPAIPKLHGNGGLAGCQGECGEDGHGFHDATSDPIKLEQWNQKFPGCNWGIATGHASGVAVIDLDSLEAEDIWAEQWFPEGEAVATPSDNRHLYYSLDPEIDIRSSNGQVFKGIDIRGDGGYVVAPGSVVNGKVYLGNILKPLPPLPEAVIEWIKESVAAKKARRGGTAATGDSQRVTPLVAPESSLDTPTRLPGEERILSHLKLQLDNLPRPWFKGAHYHATEFNVACQLWRIVRTPEHFTITEQDAYDWFIEHAPIGPEGDNSYLNKRWESARDQTIGQTHEPPGDVPALLDPLWVLEKYKKTAPELERHYWDVKHFVQTSEFIKECRRTGLSDREAYSLATAISDNLAGEKGMNRVPQWGHVRKIYDEEITPVAMGTATEVEVIPLLTEAEREIADGTPNFIDHYMHAVNRILPEPNRPLHYLNAWLTLSSTLGDCAWMSRAKRLTPLNMWGFSTAGSAQGKGDARFIMEAVIGRAYGGKIGKILLSEPSAEAMTKILVERDKKVSFVMEDEASAMLESIHDKNSWQGRSMNKMLDMYDGRVKSAARAGSTEEDAQKTASVVLNVWLQTTWDKATDALDNRDLSSGFIGRFIPAIGEKISVTKESVDPGFVDEYQFDDGINPQLAALGDALAAIRAGVSGSKLIGPESNEIIDRYKEMSMQTATFIRGHRLAEHLLGIVLRLNENILKGACLLALSEGRKLFTMTDLLVSMRSGEIWLRDMVRFAEGISSSQYRKQIDRIIQYIQHKPRREQEIFMHFENLDAKSIKEYISRGESEGRIKRVEGGKWTAHIEADEDVSQG